MPFTLPKTVQRNPLRYIVVRQTEDFLLQRHRRSLRSHPFPFRIITADKPHVKVATGGRFWTWVDGDQM